MLPSETKHRNDAVRDILVGKLRFRGCRTRSDGLRSDRICS